jgi:hypothetical protein
MPTRLFILWPIYKLFTSQSKCCVQVLGTWPSDSTMFCAPCHSFHYSLSSSLITDLALKKLESHEMLLNRLILQNNFDFLPLYQWKRTLYKHSGCLNFEQVDNCEQIQLCPIIWPLLWLHSVTNLLLDWPQYDTTAVRTKFLC